MLHNNTHSLRNDIYNNSCIEYKQISYLKILSLLRNN